MPKINLLPSEIYNKISAGEVVENPASVVKELVENSIDAGATRISIDISGGGLEKISVSDDGCGIEKNDIYKAFMPHATSKIVNEDDLFNISTLGFRGEALPSIASVAKVRIRSKYIDCDMAYELTVKDGEFSAMKETPLDVGTVIDVEDLFKNVPARLKFMKKAKSEEASVTTVVEKLILSHPYISFSYTADGKNIYLSQGCNLEDAFYTVLGKTAYENRIKIHAVDVCDVRLEGFVCSEKFTRPNRNGQTLIVNGRCVTDTAISAVVQNAFGDRLMRRNFPVFVLQLNVPFKDVDVNVHPSKAEVRFKEPRYINGFIYDTIKTTLFQHDLSIVCERGGNYIDFNEKIPEDTGAHIPAQSDANCSFFGSSNTSPQSDYDDQISRVLWGKEQSLPTEFAEQETKIRQKTEEELYAEEMERAIKEEEENRNKVGPLFKDGRRQSAQERNDVRVLYELGLGALVEQRKFENSLPDPDPNIPPELRPYSKKMPKNHTVWDEVFYFESNKTKSELDKEYQNISAESNEKEGERVSLYSETLDKELYDNLKKNGWYKILGQFANCYLVVATFDTLHLIDQHAAHERYIYDAMMAKMESGQNYTQSLLVPVVMDFAAADYIRVAPILDELNNMGFEIDEFGTNTIKISAVPSPLVEVDMIKFFENLLASEAYEKRITVASVLREKIIQTSCKTAIKAGYQLSNDQMHEIVENALALKDGLTCPHGRPIVVSFSLDAVEKMFKRTV